MNSTSETAACGCSEYRELERRAFLETAWRMGAAALISAPAWLPRMAFAADSSSARDLIVCVFLRGGADGLTLCVPHGDADYYAARPNIAVARPDAAADPSTIDLNGFFGLPPGLAALKPIYDAGQLAIVHATGLTDSTRSHFDAQDRMEAGSPGAATSFAGWLARHLLAVQAPQDIRLRAMAAGVALPRSLGGAPQAIAVPDIESYGLVGRPQSTDAREAFLASHYAVSPEPARTAASNVLATIDLIEQLNSSGYSPEGGAVYPGSPWGKGLRTIAQIAKADVGLEVATVDLGGWDTHAQQGSAGGQMHNLMSTFADGLSAFNTDMGARMNTTTLVVMSEFGRRVGENFSRGTDHGHGNTIFVMGGHVAGGQVIANWPGLHTDQLDDHRDLAITIDYRDVLSEVLVRRAGNSDISSVFAGYSPTFRGVTQ